MPEILVIIRDGQVNACNWHSETNPLESCTICKGTNKFYTDLEIPLNDFVNDALHRINELERKLAAAEELISDIEYKVDPDSYKFR